ncbi:VOC family protein [[Enterobacter] lignolyticus]|uniref:Glyoxalase n=1 Tax=[Enterobacter] lignolyticus TaxID=1334193 RepID=A0A806XDA0_9ENTR|nr:VOC family protein [[Enterobacter] lignolyticus]ALR76779.1 glyoxalase [[Enterobacter] lignolyticus]
MNPDLSGIDVLFVAGFGPITLDTDASKAFYADALGLPLKSMEGNSDYLLTGHDALKGVKHFALWPLSQAAISCFGTGQWPVDLPTPQAWIEFEVRDIGAATRVLKSKGYRLLVAQREEPWGQTVTRLLSPEGLLAGVTITPWLRQDQKTE